MVKARVLFICVHNSARSQMAEAYLNALGGDRYEADSAGFAPTRINPLVVRVMQDDGIDLTNKATRSVFDCYRSGKFYGYIVTVCSRAQEAECPTFPGIKKRYHWDLENPEDYTGSEEEKLEKLRDLQKRVKKLVIEFIAQEDDS